MKASRTNLYLGLTVVTCLNFVACSKYEDGPAFSIRSKKGRITGEWEVVKLSLNGTAEPMEEGVSLSFEFEKDGDFKQNFSYSYGGSSYSYSYAGEWEFEDKSETLEITIGTYVQELEIIELRNNSLKLKDTEGTDEYLWEFSKL